MRVMPQFEMGVHTCVFVSYFRSVRVFVAPTVAVIGHPRRVNLTHEEAVAFTAAGVHIPDHLFVYRHLLLVESDRLITSESCSRATKRNNSCVKYESGEGLNSCFGILKKLVMVKDCNRTETCYALLQTLRRASFQLCHDSITNAKLNDHIIAFHPPRLVTLLIIILCVFDLFTALCVQGD